MIALIVPLFLLGVIAVPTLIISGLVYLSTESREAGLTAKWSGIILAVCVVLVVVLFFLTAQ